MGGADADEVLESFTPGYSIYGIGGQEKSYACVIKLILVWGISSNHFLSLKLWTRFSKKNCYKFDQNVNTSRKLMTNWPVSVPDHGNIQAVSTSVSNFVNICGILTIFSTQLMRFITLFPPYIVNIVKTEAYLFIFFKEYMLLSRISGKILWQIWWECGMGWILNEVFTSCTHEMNNHKSRMGQITGTFLWKSWYFFTAP